MHRTKHSKTALTTGLLAAAFAINASAEVVTVSVEAEVVYVEDIGGNLGGAVQVGNVVTGTYTYNTTTPDTNAFSTVGDYWHFGPQYGIALTVNGLRFRTDPSDTEFVVEIVNNHQGSDNYLLRSYQNLFDIVVPGGNPWDSTHISWQLDDDSMHALASTKLTPNPPRLADWDSIYGLDITSSAGGDWFLIRSVVRKAEVVSHAGRAP